MINRECLKKVATKKGYTYNEESNHLRMVFPKDGTKKDLWYFYDNGQWVLVETDGRNPKALSSGKWECNGNENFKIIMKNYTYDGDSDTWSESTPEADPNAGTTTDSEDFACILKNKNVRGPVATVSSDGNSVSFFVDEPNKVSHIFYKDKKWVQSRDGVNEFTGTWECDGEFDHHFRIRSGNKSYSSYMNSWDDVIIANDEFPLKFGSQGPRVVRLQKFLNDKLPNNKLTVDGIFDEKTEKKLIEFQRKEGIIQ